jgi:hypothetical protein
MWDADHKAAATHLLVVGAVGALVNIIAIAGIPVVFGSGHPFGRIQTYRTGSGFWFIKITLVEKILGTGSKFHVLCDDVLLIQ